MNYTRPTFLISLIIILVFASCKKLDELDQKPEIDPLKQGFQVSAAIGYCASLANAAFKGETLPDNVVFEKTTHDGYSGSGLIYVHVTEDHPLPFNKNYGDIIIAGLWDGEDSGVISIIFADIDLLSTTFNFSGIHTVPVFKRATGEIATVFAEQDIVTGEGSDTLIELSLSKIKFDAELNRVNSQKPDDVFVAVKQNVWFIDIDTHTTIADVYDDTYNLSGGGQILEARSNSGGILYHAMIDTKFCYTDCSLNPLDGVAFIQNLKAAGSSIDLGNITLQFHNTCDGGANVKIATGKYIGSNGKNITLNWK